MTDDINCFPITLYQWVWYIEGNTSVQDNEMVFNITSLSIIHIEAERFMTGYLLVAILGRSAMKLSNHIEFLEEMRL